jgi:hypothetical protein
MLCAMSLLEQSEVLYRQLQEIGKRLEEIEKATETLFQYGPFRMASDFKYKLRTERLDLIQKCFELLRARVAPMAKLDEYLPVKMMNDCLGNDEDFSAKCMQSFFDALEANHAKVQELSLRTIMQRARKFLPYSNAGGQWGLTKNAEDLLESGSTLVLKAYSWSADRINYMLNSDQEYNALHKAIEIALFDMDPAKTERYRQLVDHIQKNHNDPAAFYLTIVVEHPAISRFRFFKNEALKIWFKNRDQALRVAKFLIGGQPQ